MCLLWLLWFCRPPIILLWCSRKRKNSQTFYRIDHCESRLCSDFLDSTTCTVPACATRPTQQSCFSGLSKFGKEKELWNPHNQRNNMDLSCQTRHRNVFLFFFFVFFLLIEPDSCNSGTQTVSCNQITLMWSFFRQSPLQAFVCWCCFYLARSFWCFVSYSLFVNILASTAFRRRYTNTCLSCARFSGRRCLLSLVSAWSLSTTVPLPTNHWAASWKWHGQFKQKRLKLHGDLKFCVNFVRSALSTKPPSLIIFASLHAHHILLVWFLLLKNGDRIWPVQRQHWQHRPKQKAKKRSNADVKASGWKSIVVALRRPRSCRLWCQRPMNQTFDGESDECTK